MEDAQFLKELVDIIEEHGDGGYEDIISAKSSYPYLYHLSEIRQNLIDWIVMDKSMHVLERNAECGALTGKLLEKAGSVTCVVTDDKHAEVIRRRYKRERERLEIVTEDVWTQKMAMAQTDAQVNGEMQYDMILLVGSVYRYIEELAILRSLLKPQSKLMLADANRLGLKYFAGCREEYGGGYFQGVEGYEGAEVDAMVARCYTKAEYAKYLNEAGFKELKFYYPYPDYKFPNSIYSDEWLPGAGELADNRRNFDCDRLQLFDERKVYDSLLAEGVFGTFSNAYLIEAYG